MAKTKKTTETPVAAEKAVTKRRCKKTAEKAVSSEPVKAEAVAEVKPAKAVQEKKAEKTAKKAPAKKAAPKTAAKKADAKPVSVEIQFGSGNYSPDEIVEKCKEAYKNGGRKVIRTIEVYVNAAEAKAFYVVNGKTADENGNAYSIDL